LGSTTKMTKRGKSVYKRSASWRKRKLNLASSKAKGGIPHER